jgi:hypothetical protein
MSSTLSVAAEIQRPVRHRGRSPLEIRWADPEPGDTFAPHPKRCSCVSRTGYRRRHHDFLHLSPAGARCVFCGVLRFGG